ncbi:hypothetical protein [Phormidesmis sp. 146-33]
MVSAFNILYSVSAVRRMFRVAAGVAVRIQKFAFVIWIHIAGQRPRFVSFADFKRHFAQRRQQEANSLAVQLDPGFENLYVVSNPAKRSSYQVLAADKAIKCNCEDFKNQTQFFGKACCKHSYAVLFYLGFDDLRDYITRS